MGGSVSIPDLKGFFDRYKEFTEKLSDVRFKEFEKGFKQIQGAMECFQALSREHNKQTASQFNIFHVLGVERKEVIISAFIANLLDPEGSHGQGSLFLKEFYKLLKARRGKNPSSKNGEIPKEDEIEKGAWCVEKEKSVGTYGRLDIAVMEVKNKYAIIIENKIKHKLRENQLEDYSKWLKGSDSPYKKNGILIYLTIDGHPYKPEEKGKKSYPPNLPISHNEDIKSWLEESLKQVSAPWLRKIIEQYLEVILTFIKGGR